MPACVLQGNCTASIVNWSWIRQQLQCATKHNTDFCHYNHYPAQTTTMLPKKATRLCTVVKCCHHADVFVTRKLYCAYQWNLTTATICCQEWQQLQHVTTCCCTFYKGTGLHPSVESENRIVFERSCKWSYKFAAVTWWLYSYMTVHSSPPVPWFLLEHDHESLMVGAE